MRYRKLGNTGLAVSEIGFGTIPILQGSVPVLPDYYNLNDEEALAVMEHAFGLGCNLYDTAIVPEYGDAERKLGLFAARVGREKLVISDKEWDAIPAKRIFPSAFSSVSASSAPPF